VAPPPPPPSQSAPLLGRTLSSSKLVRQNSARPVASLAHGGVVGMCEYLELAGGLDEPEIFKQSMAEMEVKRVLDSALQANEDTDQLRLALDKCSLQMVAAAVKQHFKGLREPVVPFDMYPQLVAMAKASQGLELATSAAALCQKVREPGRSELLRLLQLLSNVRSVSKPVLAYSFGPALMHPQTVTMDGLGEVKLVNSVIQACIEHFPAAFQGERPAAKAPPKAPPALPPALPPNKPKPPPRTAASRPGGGLNAAQAGKPPPPPPPPPPVPRGAGPPPPRPMRQASLNDSAEYRV
jgi:hypothetical protein